MVNNSHLTVFAEALQDAAFGAKASTLSWKLSGLGRGDRGLTVLVWVRGWQWGLAGDLALPRRRSDQVGPILRLETPACGTQVGPLSSSIRTASFLSLLG
jgi:hypothetical protein